VTFHDWLLVFHVLAAFAYVAALVLFWVLVVAIRRIDTPDATLRLDAPVKVGGAFVGVGSMGTIVFGIWLAIVLDRYEVWNGWLIAAIVLWLIAAELGRRTGKEYERAMEKARELAAAGQTKASAELGALNRTSTGVALHALASLAVLLILIDMIWKPGA
jgi:uncharacterized membrane protein